MANEKDIPDNLIEIIPYIELRDFQTALKHIKVYANQVEANIKKVSGWSCAKPPSLRILSEVERNLAKGLDPATAIQKMKDFDAAYCEFVAGIPSYKRKS